MINKILTDRYLGASAGPVRVTIFLQIGTPSFSAQLIRLDFFWGLYYLISDFFRLQGYGVYSWLRI